MIFNTAWFPLFLTLTTLLMTITPARVRAVTFLLCCGVFHYHYAGAAGMAAVLALGLVVYILGIFPGRTGLNLVIGIILCVGALVYYKYRAFLGQWLGVSWPLGAIPLGISFFTFEFIHYLVERHQGGKPLRSPQEFGLFTLFFPSLVAGPIKRYPHFQAQLRSAAAFKPTAASLLDGGTRFTVGFAKKVVLADPLAELCAGLFPHVLQRTGGVESAWLLLAATALHIYLDFSAYSDMAIGVARIFQIELPENFNWPYAARSIQDFWRRWHISLSSWIRDYVYIPLGGSRHGLARQLATFLFAFLLCGLWHGPAVHFGVWGLWHGAGLGMERWLQGTPTGKTWLASWTGWLSTQLFVALGWLIFFYPVEQAWRLATALVGAG